MEKPICELCGDKKCDCDKELRVKFCPKCKSTNIKYTFELLNLYGMIPRQRCLDCGLEGTFPILVTTKRKLATTKRKKVKKRTAKKSRRSHAARRTPRAAGVKK